MIRSIMALLLVFAAGCVSSLQTDSAQDPAVEFSHLETFAWLAEEELPGDDVRVRDERVRKTVHDAIEQTLIAKGYRKTGLDQADFVVAWFGAIEQKIKKEYLDHLYSPYGYGTLLRDPALNRTTPQKIEEFEEGTLIIDLARSVSRILDPIPSR